MISSTHRRILIPTVLLAGGLALAGCTAPAEPVTSASVPPSTAPVTSPTASPVATPTVSDQDAVATVTTYLEAIQQERWADAFALLTPESQELTGTEEQFTAALRRGITAPEPAAGFLGADGSFTTAPGPVAGSVLVSATRDRIADAWLVRSGPEGLRVDQAGVPATGESPYEWVNPATGPEDVSDFAPYDPAGPASIAFADLVTRTGAEGRSLVGYPSELTAYLGADTVPATSEESGTTRTWTLPLDPAALEAGTAALTVVWEVEPGSDQWRTATTAVYLD